MTSQVVCDFLQYGEEASVTGLILTTFDLFVAPEFAQEGIVEFKKYATVEAIADRLEAGSIAITAKQDAKIVGIIEVRDLNHVAMLFVDPSCQQQGIGKALLAKAIEVCSAQTSDLKAITVNSSPNAVDFYLKAGFEILDQEQLKNGIRSTPMKRVLNKSFVG